MALLFDAVDGGVTSDPFIMSYLAAYDARNVGADRAGVDMRTFPMSFGTITVQLLRLLAARSSP